MNSSTQFAPLEELSFDYVVCGGGLAGLCGAVFAARQGLKVALVQDRPVLGGNSSSEVRVHVQSAGSFWPWAVETGVISEVMDEERYRNPQDVFEASTCSLWDLILYEWAHREESLELFLNTSVRGVEMSAPVPDGLIHAVRCSQLGTEKEFSLQAPLFCDSTGDGTVAALAGAAYRYGREARREFDEPMAPEEADDVTQGATIQFRTMDLKRPVPFHAPDWAARYPNEESLVWRNHRDPRGGYWWIEIGYPFHTIQDNEKIRHELQRHVLGVFDHIKNHGDHGAENLALEWVGSVPGKRESRRVIGPTIMTEHDLRSRRLFADRVAYGGWFLDEHVTGGLMAVGEKPERTLGGQDTKDLYMVAPYSIPLGSLRSRDVRNLFLAGRDISATHIALSSARVMGTCAIMGQAVAGAATVCRRFDKSPDTLNEEEVGVIQQLLLKEDCFIPRLRNTDPADLALKAKVSAESAAELELPFGERWLELTHPTAQILPLTADRLEALELFLENRSGAERKLRLTLKARSDLWDFSKEDNLAEKEMVLKPGVPAWVRFDLGATIDPGLYWIVLESAPDVFWGQHSVPPPGTAVATFRASECWRFEGRRGNWPAMAVRVTPASRPFEADNVINGFSRPESAANLWISDPHAPLPQSVTLKLDRPESIREIRLTFDNNLNRWVQSTPPNFVAPELVRDYRVEVRQGGHWNSVVDVKGNRHRLRVHRIPASLAEEVRLTVTATNGMPMARVYEIRLYGES